MFFEKILKYFHVVHNHPNNYAGLVNLGSLIAPRVFELTFLRKDRSETTGFADHFPHPLDQENNKNGKDIQLPENWFGINK